MRTAKLLLAALAMITAASALAACATGDRVVSSDQYLWIQERPDSGDC